MPQRPNRSTALLVTIVVTAIVLAAANVAVLVITVRDATGAGAIPAAETLSTLYVPGVIYFAAAPLVAGLLIALLALRRGGRRAPPVEAVAPTAPPPSPTAALRLLGLLQQEARLVDFIEEDIDGYSDEQVGAAVRSIHSGCRKVLHEHVQLQRIFAAEDGSETVIDKGFDPAAVRLTGNVTGEPPFRGTLQHGGWRAADVALPETTIDPSIIAPAEVEIP